MGFSPVSKLSQTWTTQTSKRQEIILGNPTNSKIDSEVVLSNLGRTNIRMIVSVVDDSGRLAAASKKLVFSPPPVDSERRMVFWISESNTINLIAWQFDDLDDLGPDETFEIHYPIRRAAESDNSSEQKDDNGLG